MKLLVFASGEGSNFSALAEKHQIALLICDVPNAPVLKRATAAGVPSLVVAKHKDETRQSHEERLWQALSEVDFQLVCLAGWRRIFSASFLARFPHGCVINIHPSLLPLHPGLGAYEKTFESGAAEGGVTVHIVDEGVDTGVPLAQARFARLPADDFANFKARGLALEHQLYPQTVTEWMGQAQTYRVEVFPREKDLLEHSATLVSRLYWLHSHAPLAQLGRIAQEVLADPVAEVAFVGFGPDYLAHVSALGFAEAIRVESGFLPGVTDNAGTAAAEALRGHRWLQGIKFELRSGRAFRGERGEELKTNPLLQWEEDQGQSTQTRSWVEVGAQAMPVQTVDLGGDDETLMKLNDANWWALGIEELRLVRDFFKREGRKPTDVEMEVIAQTWSEHCKHKIFRARIQYEDRTKASKRLVDSLFKTYVKGATDEVTRQRGLEWLVSIFHDNAGVVRWDSKIDVAVKVETHNSPSALDPYGGALTGILGVNRDILGVGMGARPIANTDVFCLAPEGLAQKLGKSWPSDVKTPETIRAGVHRGVKDGGNKSGIPTVNGAFHYDVNYAGKPLVYCGTVGVMPQTVGGLPASVKRTAPGDHIVMVGGRIGKDGLHGATFSSQEWKEGTPASVVQIGDPFTQKRVADFLLEARDRSLYTGLTDNGAGGLSSSVGEMAQATNGAEIDLALAPVKYPGLAPWELMVSESQERMTFAVAPSQLQAFLALAESFAVEASPLGTFTDSGELRIRHGENVVGRLPLAFLHEGLPAMELSAVWEGPREKNDWCETPWPRRAPASTHETLLTLLGAPNIRSHESWVRQYDHEVQAASLRKPFDTRGVSGDAGLIDMSVHGGEPDRGLAISCGLAPTVSRFDTYTMALWAVDEAVRNAVCVGGDPDHMALCDNFCWPDPITSTKNPDGAFKLAQLVRACEAMAEACIAYGAPLVSGKDSMKNDAHLRAPDGSPLKISVLPTLLMTCIADVPKIQLAPPSAPPKADLVVGWLSPFEVAAALTLAQFYKVGEQVPQNPPLEKLARRYRAFHALIRAGKVLSAHDVSEGGVLAALGELVTNQVGFYISLPRHSAQDLFGEACGMIIFTCEEADFAAFSSLEGVQRLGTTTATGELKLETSDGKTIWSAQELHWAHKGVL